jgi:hypothetical protein
MRKQILSVHLQKSDSLTVPLLIIDDLGMRKSGPTAAEELLEIVMRRYERTTSAVSFTISIPGCRKTKVHLQNFEKG